MFNQSSQSKTKIDRHYITGFKNAFGEVHHNLIRDVLLHHHIPQEIIEIIKHLYTNFFTCVSTSAYSTEFIHFGRGVLQGDCISPLLFNLIINTFIQHIKQKEYEQLGYKFSKYFSPRHWYQFADDASVITGQEHEAQILLNAFTRWCSWSDMTSDPTNVRLSVLQKEVQTQYKPIQSFL